MRGRPHPDSGLTLVEVLVACALAAGLAAMSGGVAHGAVDRTRARQAARHLAGELARARALALARSVAVAISFGPDTAGVPTALYADGNGNGVRAAEIASGTDFALSPPRRLAELFPGVRFGVVDPAAGTLPVRLGGTRLVTFSPLGTSTSGSLYLAGRDGSQYVLRIAGAVARVRVLRLNRSTGTWGEL
ncbi:MAG: GspH/FimT family pseudopilin [Vicinamibacterales bacterium]